MPDRLIFSILVFIVHVCSCPSASKGRIRLLLKQGFITAAWHFVHLCNGKWDNHLSPRNSFISNNNNPLFPCWKTLITIRKINILYVECIWLDWTVLELCPLRTVFCFYSFSRQGQTLFKVLGKDRLLSRRSAKHFSLWCIPAVLLTMNDKVFLGLCAGLSRVRMEIMNSRSIIQTHAECWTFCFARFASH